MLVLTRVLIGKRSYRVGTKMRSLSLSVYHLFIIAELFLVFCGETIIAKLQCRLIFVFLSFDQKVGFADHFLNLFS